MIGEAKEIDKRNTVFQAAVRDMETAEADFLEKLAPYVAAKEVLTEKVAAVAVAHSALNDGVDGYELPRPPANA